jgi:ABC-2 type transport system permease protein
MNATTATIARRPAPLGFGYYLRALLQETRYEFIGRMRLRAFSLSVIGFPVMFYALFGLMNGHTLYATYLVATYSCFGMIGACLFGIGVGVSHERMQGWLDLKMASPMPRWSYLAAKLFSCAAFALIIVTLLLALGLAFAGVHITPTQTLALYGVTLAGAIPFSALGILIALLVPPNAAPAIINLIYLPMSFASGLWMPIKYLPHWLQRFAPVLPAYHYGQLALGIFGYAQPGPAAAHWEALATFTCLMLGAAWWIFSRSETRA